MSTDTLGTALADMTMRAAAAIIHRSGKPVAGIDTKALTDALREELNARIGTLLDEAKVLHESGNGGWLNSLAAATATEAAKAALVRCGI